MRAWENHQDVWQIVQDAIEHTCRVPATRANRQRNNCLVISGFYRRRVIFRERQISRNH